MASLWFIVLFGLQLVGLTFALQQLSTACSGEALKTKVTAPKHMICFQNIFNLTAFKEEFRDDLIEGKLPDLVKKYCPKLKSATTCVDGIIADIGECFKSPVDRYALKSAQRMIESVVEYLCYDGGRRILGFVSAGGLQCLAKNGDQLERCVKTKEGTSMFDMKDLQQTGFPTISNMSLGVSASQCEMIFNASDCFLANLKAVCPGGSVHEFFYGLINAVMKHTPCWSTIGNLENIEPEHLFFAGLVPAHVIARDRKCEGGVSALDFSVKAVNNATVCWKRHIDNALLKEDGGFAFMSGKLDDFLSKYCPKFQDLSICVGEFLDTFQLCVEDKSEDSVTLKSTKKVALKLTEYLCHNKGERILQFLMHGGLECVKVQQKNIESCMADANATFLSIDETTNDIDSLIQQAAWAPQRYDEKDCQMATVVNSCLGKSMNKCNDTEPAKLIHNLLKELAEQTPCLSVEPLTGTASFAIASPFIIALLLFFVKLSAF